MKKTIKQIFRHFGIDIQKSKKSYLNNTMLGGLQRSKMRNMCPKTIIDVGAAQGKWSLEARNIWRKANSLLFEPLYERGNDLDRLSKQFNNFYIVKAGAGNEIGTVDFFVTKDLDGSGIADNDSGTLKRIIPVTTIDCEVSKLKLESPYLIKLDTHGFEIPIIEGMTVTLKKTELIIIECYGFRIAPKSLLFWEMCQYMDSKGFRLIDIVDVKYREKDKAFWQCDAFFVPKTNESFKSNIYL